MLNKEKCPETDRDKRIIERLLLEKVHLTKQISQLKRMASDSTVSVSVLLNELDGRKDKRLVDIKNLISFLNKYDTLDSSNYFRKIAERLSKMLSCKVTLYIAKSGFKRLNTINSIDDLKHILSRVYGEDDIFEIFPEDAIMDLLTIKEVSSYQSGIVAPQSVGSYLIGDMSMLEGFIFFNSYTAIDRNLLEVIIMIISTSVINFQYLSNAILELKESNKKRNYDEVLDMRNQRAFDSDKRNFPYNTMAIIDIDKFKGVNDNYGHKVGDMALKELSYIFNNNLIPYDESIRCYRYGGDEFTILSSLPDNDFKELLEKTVKEFENKVLLTDDRGDLTCTLSVGVCTDVINYQLGFNWADKFLRDVKTTGRGRIKYGKCGSTPIQLEEIKRVYD